MYLAHIPVNHHLRPLYRALIVVCGLYLVVVGIYGIVETSGLDLFARDGLPEVLGQQLNPAGAGLLLVFGIAVLAVTVLGRNIDHFGNFWLGQLLVIVATLSMAFLRTDANLLGFSMTSVIVSMVVGLLVWAGSLYLKVGPERPAHDEGRTDTRDVQHPRAHA
jgi:Na+/melibiose symporter-like transporter